MSTIRLVQGDDLPDIAIVLRDNAMAAAGARLDPADPETWAPIDLTGATVRAYWRRKGSEGVTVLPCVVSDPPENGRFVTSFGPNTLDVEPGAFEMEFEVEFADGRKQTVYELLDFIMRGDLQ